MNVKYPSGKMTVIICDDSPVISYHGRYRSVQLTLTDEQVKALGLREICGGRWEYISQCTIWTPAEDVEQKGGENEVK